MSSHFAQKEEDEEKEGTDPLRQKKYLYREVWVAVMYEIEKGGVLYHTQLGE